MRRGRRRCASEGGIDAQHHAFVQTEASSLAGADLQHVAGPPASGHPPRREVLDNTHDLEVGVAEDDVERHPHEEHVDRLLAERESLARRQFAAAEQAAGTAHETPREAEALEQRPPVRRLHAMPGIHPTPTVVRHAPAGSGAAGR
jgi:hypothetical protein